MQRNETKSAKILRLYGEGGHTVKEIAGIVGCSPAYVRVVARQRKGGGQSKADRKYNASSLGIATRKQARNRNREALLAYSRVLYRTGDHAKARAAYREARHA